METIDPDLSKLLVDHYGLQKFSLLRVLQTTGQRQTLLLGTPAGKLVVKLTHPARDEATVAAETGILAHLARHTFPAPAPVPARDGRLYRPFDNRFISVYQYLEGTHPRPDDGFFAQLGRLMARLHALSTEGFDHPSTYRPAPILDEAKDFLASVEDPEHQAAVDELLEIIEHFPALDNLPTGLIHTDPCYSNLLALADGSLALIDWDDSGVSYPLLDVAYVVAYLCAFFPWDREKLQVPGDEFVTWRPDWAHCFIQAYHSVRPLSPLEKARFQDAIRLNYLVYIRDWETGRFIHEYHQCMKITENFSDPMLI